MNLEQLASQAEQCVENGELDKAVELYTQILAVRSDDADLHHILGLVYAEQRFFNPALDHIQQAIELEPNKPVFHRSLGDLLQSKADDEAAIAAYEKALSLMPNDPDTLLNMGNAIQKTGDYENAMACYRQVLDQDGEHLKAIQNIGKTFYDQGDLNESLKWYNKAIQLQPSYAEAQFSRSLALLLSGDFAQGWPAYEWRFKRSEAKQVYPHDLQGQRWNGSPFGGERLLVHCEQGLGDVIQFCRYLPMVKSLGGTLIVETHDALTTLIERMPALDQVIAFNPDNPPNLPYSQHIALMSLPGLFNTNLSSIPDKIPYLEADADKKENWQKHLARQDGKGLRVGLVWAGSSVDPQRSCPMSFWLPWCQIPGLQLYSLQKGQATEELKALDATQHSVHHLGDALHDFDDTAAVIANMDLIISIDTAVAHLAGALGKPVWVLLPHVPDWRWLMERSDSPWYPTAHLFRQTALGNWASVTDQVAQALSGKNQIKTTNATIEPEFQTPQDEENSTLLEKGCHSIDEGDFKTAIKVFQRLIAAHPRWAEVHFNLGRAYQAQGRLVQAIQAYHAAIRLAPQLEEAHINLGLAYHQDGQLDKAAESYRQTIALHSNLALVFNNIGVLQEQQNDLSAAESSYQCALRIDPNNGDAHYNLGNIHLSHSRLDQAIVSYQNTLASNPQHVKALCNLGLTFHRKGLLDEALAHYNQALKFKPDYAEAHFNRAITLLLVGDWETGWQDYEWRFSCHDWKRTYPHRLYGDRWDGAAFKNKTLLVHSEQGIGDALHFARYLPLVKQRGGRVIFEARKSLLPLFDSLDCIDELIELSEDKAPGRHYHWHVPLCSLGYIFESTPSNLPNKVPYLKADPDKVAQWRKRLPLEGLNVGLVWGGNDTYKERSCTLEQMTPLAFVKGINWIGLQKGPAAAQASRDLLPRNFSLTNWGEEFIDFSDTAAAVDCLDLIISIDTSVAHLAGAMGKPVWILLPIVPDWRWMLERSQTPWYPTMHLFRQSKARGWPYVVAHLSSALERWRKRHAR